MMDKGGDRNRKRRGKTVTGTMDSIISLTVTGTNRTKITDWKNKLATSLLLQIVASPDTNASHSSSAEKDGSLRLNLHSE